MHVCRTVAAATAAAAAVTVVVFLYKMLLPTTTFPFDTCFEVSRAPSSHFTFIFRLTIAYRFSFLLFSSLYFSLSFVRFSLSTVIFVCTLPLSLIIVTIYVIIRFGSENEITVVLTIWFVICYLFRYYFEFVVKIRMDNQVWYCQVSVKSKKNW